MVVEMHLHPEIRKWNKYHQRYIRGDAGKSLQAFRRFFDRLPKDRNQLFLLAKLDGKVVGFLGIHRFEEPRGHVGDVGIEVHPDHQGKGIGTKLLRAGIKLARRRGFKRLEVDTLATNIAMRKSAERAGFKLEGMRRKYTRMRGRLLDTSLYAILL